MSLKLALCLGVLLCLCSCYAHAGGVDGDSVVRQVFAFPDKLFGVIDRKASLCQQKVRGVTVSALRRMEKKEEKMKRRLARRDSAAAERTFGNVDSIYASMERRYADPSYLSANRRQFYSGHLDSVQTAMSYLDQSHVFQSAGPSEARLDSASAACMQLQKQLGGSMGIGQEMAQRQQLLSQRLQAYGPDTYLAPLRSELNGYRAQVKGYTDLYNDPDKLEDKLLTTLKGAPSFQRFFNSNSQLASLFALPGANVNVTGLPTRNIVMQQLQQQMGNGSVAQQSIQQGMDAGQGELSSLKSRLDGLKSGSTGGAGDMPDYTPDESKSKSLWKRLEVGINLQTTKSNVSFPITTDFGLSLGYKLSSKSIIGVGGSFNVGWGSDIQHVNVTGQGIGLRSFAELRLRGTWWLSGGLEYNYLEMIKSIRELYANAGAWQTSALFGLDKKVHAGGVNSSIQLLYDALWKSEYPQGHPFVFRVGYNF